MVVGDGHPYLTALIGLDVPAMLAVSQREGLGCHDLAALARHPRIRQIVQAQVDRHNADVAGFEQIRKFAILDVPPSPDERTPTDKLRRRETLARHAATIDELYA
jgi:long-chain acyl-CoA synthetase